MLLTGITIRSRHIYIGLFLLSFVFYFLFSQLVPITDPVESNYALTAKEMVVSGNWLSPQIYGQVWFDKPVFFYWLTAAMFKLLGITDLAARLMPALFGGLGMVLVYWFLNKTTNQAVALLAALVMGTSLEYALLAKFIITDMVLYVFNSAALVFFYLGYTGADGTKRWYLVMYASMALAVLTKGPVGLLLPGLVMLLFIAVKRNWRELGKMSIPAGVIIFSGITLPWYGAMYYAYGADFINTFFGVHNYLRATVSEHPNDNVFYYYVVVFLLGMLPWSLLTVKAIMSGFKSDTKQPLWLFSYIWAGVYLVFYTLMATKYLTYTFPIFFPLAAITGNYLEQLIAQNKKKTLVKWVGSPILIATIGYVVLAKRYIGNLWLILAVSCLVLVLLFVGRQIKKQQAKQTIAWLSLCHIAAYLVVAMFVFPTMAAEKSGKEIANTLYNYKENKVGFYDFYSTSAVYYSGKIAVKLTPAETSPTSQQGVLSWSSKYTMPTETLAKFVTNSPQDTLLIVVPDERRGRFLSELKDRTPELLQQKRGFSYYQLAGN